MNPLEPRPPGPEKVMPQAWGSDRRDEECASERRSDKPLGEAWLAGQASRDAGRGSRGRRRGGGEMSYGKVIAGLGIALVALLALGAGITLAAQWRVAMQAPPSSWTPQAWGMHGMGWGMMNQAMVAMGSEGEEEHCPMMKGEFEKDKGKHAGFANLTTISGTVKSVNLTRGWGFIVVTSGGKDYNVFVKKAYVRTSDGVLVFGGWILGNVKQGNSIEVKGFGKNSNILAVEIVWNGNTYQIPAYYMYVLSTGS